MMPPSWLPGNETCAAGGDEETEKMPCSKPADQIVAFRKVARELGCDESEERVQEALGTIEKIEAENEGRKTAEFGLSRE